MKTTTVRNLIVTLASLLLFSCVFSDASGGLALNFNDKTCPAVYNSVESVVGQYISKAPTLAALLLRMQFHDCFVRVSIFQLSSAIYLSSNNSALNKNGIYGLFWISKYICLTEWMLEH